MRGIRPRKVIGVCQQPTETLSMWFDNGVNTVVDMDLNIANPQKFVDEATRLGMYQIRKPIGNPADDAKNPFLLAWSFPDEPEIKGITAAQMASTRSTLLPFGVPLFCNFDGSRLLGIQGPPAGMTLDYPGMINQCDWLCSDIYPISGWMGNVALDSPANASQKLLTLGKGKPVLQYVECCRQGLSWLPPTQRGPTVNEFENQLEQARILDLRGVILFSICMDQGWSPTFPVKGFDNSSVEIKRSLQKFSREWAGGPNLF